MKTYWLTGQEQSRKKKLKKSETLQAKPTEPSTRSSMKQPNKASYSKDLQSRRLSLESPKKLRFAPSTSVHSSPKSSPSRKLDPTDRVQSCDRIRSSSTWDTTDPRFDSNWYLIGKRNSYPCLGMNCKICKRLDRTHVQGTENQKLASPRQCLKHQQKGKVSRLTSSFVSCLGEKKYFVVYDKFQDGNLCHSESEPFLPPKMF